MESQNKVTIESSSPIQIPIKKSYFDEIERTREKLKESFGLSKTPDGGLFADKK